MSKAHRIIEKSEAPMKLRYFEPADHDKDDKFEHLGDSLNSNPSRILSSVDDDRERWSLPIGNGYFGINVFGRTDTERLTVADKTPGTENMKSDTYLSGGLNTFTEIFIDLGHDFSGVS